MINLKLINFYTSSVVYVFSNYKIAVKMALIISVLSLLKTPAPIPEI